MSGSSAFEPDRGAVLRTIFLDALDTAPGERGSLLEARCGTDAALRREVEALLEAGDEADEYLWSLARRARAPLEMEGTAFFAEGRQLGAYRLLRQIGQGGMGAVYLAERADRQFEKEVAVKLLPLGLDTGAARERFLAERRILAGLEHPGIARLLDAGIGEDGTPFFVMEYVDGEPIDRYCQRRNPGIAERIGLFLQVCAAVEYAHRNLVVHRDLKPGNILVTPDGTARLLDFGIAKVLGAGPDAGSTALTRKAGLVMTPAYASPEQVRGEAVTTLADVYALGVLLYELLVGRAPFQATGLSPAQLEQLICSHDPVPPSVAAGRNARAGDGTAAGAAGTRIARQLRGDLDTIVLMALRKEPSLRYGSVAELVEDVRRYLDGLPVRARVPSARYRFGKFARRNRLAVTVTGLLLAGLIAGLAGAITHSTRLEAERDRARFEAARATSVTAFLIDLFDDAGSSGARDTLSVGRLLARGEERLGPDMELQPLVRIELLDALSRAYDRTGLDEAARRMRATRLEAVRDHFGPGHLRTADALVAYGMGRIQARHWEAGLAPLEEGVAILRALPHQGQHTAEIRGLLQNALWGMSRGYREVARLDESLLAVQEYFALRLDPESGKAVDDDVAEELAMLAFVLRGHQRYDEAAALYEEAIALARSRPNGVDPAVLNNYASLLRAMGRLDEAELHFRESRDGILARGPDEFDESFVYTVHHNLASILTLRGRYAEAVAIAIRARALTEAAYPADHWRAARATGRVGVAYMDGGDCAAAEPHLRTAFATYRTALGADHTWAAQARALLGTCLVELGRLPEAEETLLASHASFGATTESNPASVVPSLEGLVRLYQALGRPDEEARYRRLLADAETG
jgi:eukaryotic-like serine/threonine-protein kinase